MKALVCSTNRHKIAELRRLFDGSELLLETVFDLGLAPLDVEEDGATFAENALKKASAYMQTYRIPALADDSGIAVDALAGAPGIRSARFGLPTFDDAGRTRYLLESLAGIAPRRRTAHYACALVYCAPDAAPIVVHGRCYGAIAEHVVDGPTGFGYDPIFMIGGHDRPVSQISESEKDLLAHRGKAARALLKALRVHQKVSGTLGV